MEIKIVWEIQPRQIAFLRACGLAHPFEGGGPKPPVADVIGYGGAAGGGKTDALLMAAIIAGLTYPGINVAFFRREYPDLEGPGGAIMRSRELMSEWAQWNGQLRRWTLPTGSIIQFCHCKTEADVYGYQSQQFDVLLVDEATQFTHFMVRFLITRNRATRPGIVPFTALATNPGNVGHEWFKKEFIDIGPPEQVHEVEVEPGIFERHIFIPSRLSDNRVLERRDPGYRRRLEAQPEEIRRALLYGDWNVFSGQVFREFRRDVHVVQPFTIPSWWRRWIANDPGYAEHFAWYWFAADHDGNVYVYREYTNEQGERIPYSQQAAKVVELTGDEKIDFVVTGMDAFNSHPETGKSIVDYYREGGLKWAILEPVHGPQSRKLRTATLHEYLQCRRDENTGRDAARLRIFETCTKLIETLPMLTADKNDPETVSKCSIDHWYDALTYGLCAWHTEQSPTPLKEKKELPWPLQEDRKRGKSWWKW